MKLNNHFLSVFSQEGLDRELKQEQMFRGQEVDRLSDIGINREIVSKEIDSLKKTKSPGPGDIFPRILKKGREELSEPIPKILRNP